MFPSATQNQIAAATGLSPAAVCMALKNNPRIPRKTRERVIAAANQLGYKRNPMLSALAAYRLARRPKAFHGVLAWFASSAEGLQWRDIPEFRAYYQGASERASKLGYKLEIFDLHEHRKAPGRLARILHNRGIRGALVSPMPQAHTRLEIPLDRLVVLAFGYTLEWPAVHRISANHLDNLIEVIAQMRRRGYRNIGYAIPAGYNERLRGVYLSAFLGSQQSFAPENRIPPFEGSDAPSLMGWIKRYQPDAVVTTRHRFSEWPASLKDKVPHKLGAAVLTVLDGQSSLAGMNECSIEIGASAAQFLTEIVERGEVGVPFLPQHLLIKSRWHEGNSVRKLNE